MTSAELDDKLLAFIRDCVDKNGFPPTVRECCAHLEVLSTSTLHLRLKRLQREGRLIVERKGNRARFEVVE